MYLLGAMGEDEPAGRHRGAGPAGAGCVLEPGLVDLLVREVEGEPGALPLLSHALRETWERREGRTLTVAGYRATGGDPRSRRAVGRGALRAGRRAQRHRAARPVAAPGLAGPQGEPVRTRVPRRLVGHGPRARAAHRPAGRRPAGHQRRGRRRDRARGARPGLAAAPRLARRRRRGPADPPPPRRPPPTPGTRSGRPDSELYRGVPAAQVREWRERSKPELTPVERSFLDASESVERVEAESAERAGPRAGTDDPPAAGRAGRRDRTAAGGIRRG